MMIQFKSNYIEVLLFPGILFVVYFKPLTTCVPHYTETNQLICTANRWTGKIGC